ncbi:hypothetical protein [Novosphingobium sp. KA1]|nr:hypothetical protein [Novosphingobium sp. KA1]
MEGHVREAVRGGIFHEMPPRILSLEILDAVMTSGGDQRRQS